MSSTPFLSGVLSLLEADAEIGAIPAAITFLTAFSNSKTAFQRMAAIAQFETNLVAGETAVAPELLGQIAPQLTASLQSELTKAQAVVTAAASKS